MTADDVMRASDADREHTVGLLRDGYVVGRLTLAEFDERTTAALSSRTWGELRELTRDLPAGGQRQFQPPVPAPARDIGQRPSPAALPRSGPGLRPVLLIALFWFTLVVTAHAAGALIPAVLIFLMALSGRPRSGTGPLDHRPPGQSSPSRPPGGPGTPGGPGAPGGPGSQD